MERFKVGDKVDVCVSGMWTIGCVIAAVDGSVAPYKCFGVPGWPDGWWACQANVRPASAPRASNGSITARLRQQVTDLSADVEKAKDETKRVCAQLDTAWADIDALRKKLNASHDEAAALQVECDALRKDIELRDAVKVLSSMAPVPVPKERKVLDLIRTALTLAGDA